VKGKKRKERNQKWEGEGKWEINRIERGYEVLCNCCVAFKIVQPCNKKAL
jgi:hypothetical protein